MSSKYGYMATIGADTSGLTAGMKEFDKQSKAITAELRQINNSLKFDDGGEVALRQKYDMLSEVIEVTRKKLEQLKASEEAINKAAAEGDIPAQQQRAYQRDLESTQNKLARYQAELEATEAKLKGTAEATDDAAHKTDELGRSAASVTDIFKANTFSDLVSDGIKKGISFLKEFAEQSLETASDITEVQNVVDVTFGRGAEDINRWSQGAKQAFGISELAAKQYTGTIGAMLKSSGVAADSISEMSENLVGLAGDIASFYNLDVDLAFQKIRSGISGETEPLKQLGINMSVANMEAFALAEGIEKSWKSMSQAEQTILRYKYLISQTADAQGDFSRTVSSYANQQRIFELNVKELQAQFGEQLLPVVNEVFSEINKELPDTKKLIEDIGKVLAESTGFVIEHKEAIFSVISAYLTFQGTLKAGSGILSAVSKVQELTKSLKSAKTAQEALNVVTEANPWLLLAAAVAAAAVALGTYMANADTTFNRLRDINKEMKEADKAFNDSIARSETEIAVVRRKAEEYEELRKKYEETGEGEERLKALAEDLQQYMPENTSIINEQTGAFNSLAESIDSVTESMRKKAYIAAYEEKYTKAVKAQVEAEEALNQITKDYPDLLKNSLKPGTVPWQGAFVNTALNEAIKTYNNTVNEVKSIEDKLNELYDGSDITSAANTGVRSNWLADRYMNDYQQSKEAAEKARALREKDLEEFTAMLDKRLNLRKISEEQYYEELKNYLDRNQDTESEAWYKQLSRYEAYTEKKLSAAKKEEDERLKAQKKAADEEKKQRDEQLKIMENNIAANKKLADDAEKERVSAIKRSWDKITLLREKGDIDEEKEYVLKARLVKQHCSENEETWNSYYSWLYNFTKRKEDEAAKERLKTWENNTKELSEQLKKSYTDLVKQKEAVKKELLDIDLTQTVKDKNGNDISILTDLNAEIGKIDKYERDMKKIKSAGASEELMDKIRGMNFADGSRQRYIDQLLALSPGQLQLYFRDFNRWQKKAESAAQEEISDKTEELNRQTADTVRSIYEDMPASAYKEGQKTAESYIQGILDSMEGVNGAADISKIFSSVLFGGEKKVSGTSSGGSEGKFAGYVSALTPININLNDKEYIKTTIGELTAQSRLSDGNVFNM